MFFLRFCVEGWVFLQQIINRILQELVGTEAFLGDWIFDHEIRKPIHVTTGLQNDLRGQVRTFHFQHVFGQNKVFPPHVHHGSLQSASGRSQIKKSLDSSVDFEGGHHEHLSNDEIIEGFSVEFRFACCNLFGKSSRRNFEGLECRDSFLDGVRIGTVLLELPNGGTLSGDLCVESIELVLDFGELFCRWCFCFRHYEMDFDRVVRFTCCRSGARMCFGTAMRYRVTENIPPEREGNVSNYLSGRQSNGTKHNFHVRKRLETWGR
mmetsp:Transcript_5584/g.13290  ORF Transcript_5584/g.13290 Transcript_5584/m.13290 type:complete len:265 (-) Transcript_5584:145-939(-)